MRLFGKHQGTIRVEMVCIASLFSAVCELNHLLSIQVGTSGSILFVEGGEVGPAVYAVHLVVVEDETRQREDLHAAISHLVFHVQDVEELLISDCE